MYKISYDRIKFQTILNQNKLFFQESVLNKLLNSKLKIQSNLLYKNLYLKNIYLKKINISSNYFYSCIYGNEKLLESKLKKLHVYYNENISKDGNYKYKYFLNHKDLKENINICIGNKNIKSNCNNIVILKISNINELRSINTDILDKNNLYIFTTQDPNTILSVSDILLLVESKYNKQIANLVDTFLEHGKEILVLPGDIWNSNCYFSNYLIKEGAGVILNINDLNMYL